MKLPLLLALPAAIAASGPRAPLGGPQQQAAVDSIYALSVRPADHGGDAVVYLLDEGVYRIEADGSTSNTTRVVVQMLTERGAQPYREQRFSWNPERQRLKVNWMRVVKPDGTVVSERPEQTQESDVPAAMGTPMYAATKVLRMSLSGLDSGTILDYSVTTESDPHMMKGDFSIAWRVTTPVYVVRSNLVVSVPAALRPRIVERNLSFRRTEAVSAGRRVYSWRTANVPKLKSAAFVPDSVSPAMTVHVSPPTTWSAIGDWYANLAQPEAKLAPPVAEKVATIVAQARTLDDSVRALHRWVAQDIRYVAIALGRGGYVPRDAETVVRTGYGDCKDKTMLFLSALRSMGVRGYPVLLDVAGNERKESPSVGQFNHMIAAVAQGGGYRFADLTSPVHPLGSLPRQQQGALAVLVRESSGQEIRLPTQAEGSSTSVITGSVDRDGVFSGRIEETRTGEIQSPIRQVLRAVRDSALRDRFARTTAQLFFAGAEADSLVVKDADALSDTLRTSIRVVRARVTSRAGDIVLFSNPLRLRNAYDRLADELERETDRSLPYDGKLIIAPWTTRLEARLRLPAGWSVTLPANLLLEGPPGRLELTFAQVGDELRITRSLTGSRELIPAADRAELIQWLRRAATDEFNQFVVRETATARAGS